MIACGKSGAIVTPLIVAMSLLACDLGSLVTPSKPTVSISSPAHGAQVKAGQELLVQANATDGDGVVRIELWVDGALSSAAQAPSPQAAQNAVLRWMPNAPGMHTLLVKAINLRNVSSEPAAVTIEVIGSTMPTSLPTGLAPLTLPAHPSTKMPTTAATTTLAMATSKAPAPPATPAACNDGAAFVEHVTVPDGTNWMPGQAFNKIWRVRNTGTCAWGPGYEFVFVGGQPMTTQSNVPVPVTAPGATADLLVAMAAPTIPGSHSGQWRLRSPKIGLFGATMTVTIAVLSPVVLPPGCPAVPVIASFSANPAAIAPGQSTTLTWGMVDNATSAVIDQGIGGVGTPGETTVQLNQTTTFTLFAIGCGGTVTKQVTVKVGGSGSNP